MVDDTGSNQTGTSDTTVNELDYNDLTKLLGTLKTNNFYAMLFTDIRNYIFNTVYGNERTE